MKAQQARRGSNLSQRVKNRSSLQSELSTTEDHAAMGRQAGEESTDPSNKEDRWRVYTKGMAMSVEANVKESVKT